ncbi:MAG: BCCT family transporter [Pseudomonadota bacterium]
MDGPKIDKTIFWMALVVIVAFAVPLVVWPAEGKAMLGTALSWSTKTLGWLFLWFTIGAFAILIYFAMGKYGKVRFGGPDARPEFSLPSWIAMLFCAGIGASVMYWGTIEWAYYYTGPPFGIEPKSQTAVEWASMYGLFHWGFTAWAVYCIPTLPLAYMYWNRKKPVLRLSSACEGVIGEARAKGFTGKIIDVLFMFGLIGGVGTSIGLGTPMLSAGLSELFGVERNFTLDVIVISIWGLIFGFSVYSGLEKGIKVLSDINLWLILFVLGFTFVFGPTIFQLDAFTNSIGLLIQNFVQMSFYVDPVAKGENIIAAVAEGNSYVSASGTFPEWWTIFYWAWWIAYAPFMGLFVARISKGRTIRELIAVEIIGGSIGCWVFFATLGNTSMFFQLDGTLDMSALVADGMAPEAIVQTIVLVGDRVIPFGLPLLIVFVILAFIFGATTMDSSAYTLSTVATEDSGEPVEPGRWHRFFWAFALAAVALALMYAGGKDSLSALQAASVVVAIPLMVVLIMMVMSLMKWLREDYPSLDLEQTTVKIPVSDTRKETPAE